jgi:hypothetical protein
MFSNQILYGICAVLLIFIIWYWFSCSAGDNFGGFWYANPDFLTETGLENMLFYVDPVDNSEGHFIMSNELGLINNASVKMNWKYLGDGPSDPMKEKIYSLTFEEELKNIPQKCTLKYYPECQKIILLDDETIYGCMYKGLEDTEMAFVNTSKSVSDGKPVAEKDPESDVDQSEDEPLFE